MELIARGFSRNINGAIYSQNGIIVVYTRGKIFFYTDEGKYIHSFNSKSYSACFSSAVLVDNEQALVCDRRNCKIFNIDIYTHKFDIIVVEEILPIKILSIQNYLYVASITKISYITPDNRIVIKQIDSIILDFVKGNNDTFYVLTVNDILHFDMFMKLIKKYPNMQKYDILSIDITPENDIIAIDSSKKSVIKMDNNDLFQIDNRYYNTNSASKISYGKNGTIVYIDNDTRSLNYLFQNKLKLK